MIPPLVAIILARGLPESFLRGLWNGESSSWITMGVLMAVLVGMHVAHKYFGWKPLIKKERRAARERRRIVLWKYERD
jgi:hypothetical protein